MQLTEDQESESVAGVVIGVVSWACQHVHCLQQHAYRTAVGFNRTTSTAQCNMAKYLDQHIGADVRGKDFKTCVI